MNDKLHKSLMWAVIASETSHVFCCVLPTMFSLFSLLAGLGMVAALPPFMVRFHEFIHHWEVPMIVISAIILALGWAITLYSEKMDCHSTGCAHGACAPRKSKAHMVLKVATILFVFNVFIYVTVHRSPWLLH